MEGQAPSPPETWDAFFSDFYLRVAAGDERQERDAQPQALGAARLASCPEGGDLLDVACGFGRHAIALAHAGYRVVGVDRSPMLLAGAHRRAGDGRSLQLVQGDYRELPFADESFDAAINLFTSLGYLGDEEDTRALGEIARVVRFSEQDWQALGGGRVLLEQRTFDAAAGVAQTTQTLIETNGERDSRTFSLRVYTATELVAMLRAAGFAEAKCYGDLDGGPFATDTRLVVVARPGA